MAFAISNNGQKKCKIYPVLDPKKCSNSFVLDWKKCCHRKYGTFFPKCAILSP